MDDGSVEAIVEVGMEPRHAVVLHNQYVRVLRVSFPPNNTTLAHRHSEDGIYFFLVKLDGGGKLSVINHVQGMAPCCNYMDFGEVRYGVLDMAFIKLKSHWLTKLQINLTKTCFVLMLKFFGVLCYSCCTPFR